MVPALVGTALNLGGQTLSLIGSAKENRNTQSLINRRRADIQNIFDRDYNQDFLNSSENRSAIKFLSDRIKERQLAQDNTRAIMGGTDEAATADKQVHARAFADLVNNVASRGTQRKDMAQRDYNAGMFAVDQAQQNLNNQKVQNWVNFGKMASQAGDALTQVDAMGSDKKSSTNPLSGAMDAPSSSSNSGMPSLEDIEKLSMLA